MIKLEGSLVTPLNNVIAPVIKFVSKTNGESLLYSEGFIMCETDGSYSSDLLFGEYDVYVDFSGVGDYDLFGRGVIINETTTTPTDLEGIL